eukprot:364989-Chlamydomonas_euryale.AAC.7
MYSRSVAPFSLKNAAKSSSRPGNCCLHHDIRQSRLSVQRLAASLADSDAAPMRKGAWGEAAPFVRGGFGSGGCCDGRGGGFGVLCRLGRCFVSAGALLCVGWGVALRRLGRWMRRLQRVALWKMTLAKRQGTLNPKP